jgi:hypothetical protein
MPEWLVGLLRKGKYNSSAGASTSVAPGRRVTRDIYDRLTQVQASYPSSTSCSSRTIRRNMHIYVTHACNTSRSSEGKVSHGYVTGR